VQSPFLSFTLAQRSDTVMLLGQIDQVKEDTERTNESEDLLVARFLEPRE
jgi:hypothetical protein